MQMAEEKFKELNNETKVWNVDIIQLSEENKKLLETTQPPLVVNSESNQKCLLM